MADITIGIIASAREWRSILQAHVRDHVAGVRVQILREPRMALELNLDVVVIDDVSSFLTRDKVVRLREKGTRVVGIYDEEGTEGLGITFLENLGVDLSLPSNISPEEMINAVSQLQPRENYSHTFDHIVADYGTGVAATSRDGDSTLIAVAGPAGTGSTEIAIALADILVARRNATLLLDCDEVGPSVARRLGFHLHPNVLSAMDTVSNVTRPLTEMVGRPGDRVASAVNFDVIPGIANPEDWAQLRSMDLEDLFIAARKSWRYIVCNTGPFNEDLSGYGIERFGATRATLEAADVIVGVMSPTPTGYMRFLDWLSSLRTLGSDRPVYVVVNNAPKSSFIRGEIENQISRDVDARFVAGLFFVPHDEHVAKAEWEGQLVSKGPFIHGVAEVASYAIPMAKSRKNRKVVLAQNDSQQGGQASQPGQGGYSTGFETPTPVAGSTSGLSWDDPDIANPPVQNNAPTEQNQAPEPPSPQLPISLDEPPKATFESNPQATQDVAQIEESLSRTMADDVVVPEQDIQVDKSQPYTYSPPQHAVESVAVEPAQSTQATQPAVQSPPAFGEGYVPAFKRGSEPEPQTSAVVEPAQPPVDPSMYTPGATTAELTPEPTQTGYVPHFLDKKTDDEDDPKSFWS